MTWNGASADGAVDVVFSRSGHQKPPGGLYRPAQRGIGSARLANDPGAAQRARRIAATLRDYLRDRLPEHMVPAVIVGLERFPFTANGKLDYAALPTPDFEEQPRGRPARNPQERALCRLFAEMLGRPEVGIDLNFFDLGGHSLLAARLISRINQEFGSDLPVAAVFDAPTVAGLSEALERVDSPGREAPTVRELLADATLDPAIDTEPSSSQPAARMADPEHVLLTGATGFVGSFLLAELVRSTRATVFCLVRGSDEADAGRRLRDVLRRYRLADAVPDGRVIPVVGDLAQPLLGLSPELHGRLAEQVDVIHHTGAWVHTMHPYRQLRSANVGGTREVLRLAAAAPGTPVHYMSTIGAAVQADGSTTTVREDCRLSAESVNPNGYVSSKWVAEQLVHAARDRGIPTTVFRPGRVSGHSGTGIGGTTDSFWLIVRTMLELGAVPHFAGDHTGIEVDLVPVDYVARAVAELAGRPESVGTTYHIRNPHLVSLDAVVHALREAGYRLDVVSPEDWSTRLDTQAAQGSDPFRVAAMFGRLVPMLRAASALRFDADHTDRALADTAIHCPDVDDDVLGRYVDYFLHTGFFPKPMG